MIDDKDLSQITTNSQETTYKSDALKVITKGAAKIGGVFGLNLLLSHIEVPNTTVGKLRYLTGFTIGGKPWYTMVGKEATSTASVREIVWNFIKGTEEELLFKIPRMFSLSTWYSEGIFYDSSKSLKDAIGFGSSKVSDHILELTPDMLRNQSKYLDTITNGKITSKMMDDGLFYRHGSLYTTREAAEKGADAVADSIRILTGKWNKEYISRASKAIHGNQGLYAPDSDFTIIGGNGTIKRWGQKANAMLKVGVENYIKLMDDPFEMLRKPLAGMADHIPGLSTVLGKGSQLWKKSGMVDLLSGVGGWKNLQTKGAMELLGKHAMRGLPLVAAGIAAYKLIDEIPRRLPFLKDTVLGGGVKGTVARAYQDLTSATNVVSDVTGLTKLKKRQEEKAPGSTSLMGLASIPMGFGIFGATIGKASALAARPPVGTKAPLPTLLKDFLGTVESSFPSTKNFNISKLGRVGAFGLLGAVAGAVAVLPFIPGALGSKHTRQEREEIYAGEKRVPIRRGRFWEFGQSPFEGEEVERLVPHWTVRAITDATKKGIYGSKWGKPFTRMAKTLMDPYWLERQNDKERPYVYWGASDYGLGLAEKILNPIKNIFKPTKLAHPEALGQPTGTVGRFTNQLPSGLAGTPDALGTSNYYPEILGPGSFKSWSTDVINAGVDLLGLQGFTISALKRAATGGQGLLTPEAVYDTSGRMTSINRSYWDASVGGMGGMSEAYRRLNPKRPYETTYVTSPIKNTMPSWIPEFLQEGDPFAAIPHGELRLPGRGYAAIHPELEDVKYEDYPSVHKLNILSDIAPASAQYYKALAQTRMDLQDNRLTDSGKRMYQNIMDDQEAISKEKYGKYDLSEEGIGKHWLTIKQVGRMLPTESLYPFAPIHKFAGPVDPFTAYKESILDKKFKSWSHPISDYVAPALYKTMDAVLPGDFVPNRITEQRQVESFFAKTQFAKNAILEDKAKIYADNDQYEEASFLRSGKRSTIYGQNPYGDFTELTSKMSRDEGEWANVFDTYGYGGKKERAISMMSHETSAVMIAQSQKNRLMAEGNLATIQAIQKNAEPIGGRTAEDLISSGDVPGPNFVGYAPGVDLNAFKVKVANNLGQNVRDYGLWKEDERKARILDAQLNTPVGHRYIEFKPHDRDIAKSQVHQYLKGIGMPNGRVVATPTIGDTFIDMQTTSFTRTHIKSSMEEQGYINKS